MALALKTAVSIRTPAARNVTGSSIGAPCRPRSRIVRMAKPDQLTEKVVESIKDAEEACSKGTKEECAVAWDNVEEISAAADKKRKAEKAEDPLEKFCADNADADECRVYED